MRVEEMIAKGARDHEKNSPCQYHRKSIENSKEKMHTDARIQRVIACYYTCR